MLFDGPGDQTNPALSSGVTPGSRWIPYAAGINIGWPIHWHPANPRDHAAGGRPTGTLRTPRAHATGLNIGWRDHLSPGEPPGLRHGAQHRVARPSGTRRTPGLTPRGSTSGGATVWHPANPRAHAAGLNIGGRDHLAPGEPALTMSPVRQGGGGRPTGTRW